jgi:hypothetical protein
LSLDLERDSFSGLSAAAAAVRVSAAASSITGWRDSIVVSAKWETVTIAC